jgi:hypothetical protein
MVNLTDFPESATGASEADLNDGGRDGVFVAPAERGDEGRHDGMQQA